MNARTIQEPLRSLGNIEAAELAARFFKTGPGEYAEGDQFLGIRVPDLRRVVRVYRGLPERKVLRLLRSPIHEHSLTALLIWDEQAARSDLDRRSRIYDHDLRHTTHINHWHLVDASARVLVGEYLIDNKTGTRIRDTLARSRNLWNPNPCRRHARIHASGYVSRDAAHRRTAVARSARPHPQDDRLGAARGWEARPRHARVISWYPRVGHAAYDVAICHRTPPRANAAGLFNRR